MPGAGPHSPAPAAADQKRKLHLSLGGNAGNGNGHAANGTSTHGNGGQGNGGQGNGGQGNAGQDNSHASGHRNTGSDRATELSPNGSDTQNDRREQQNGQDRYGQERYGQERYGQERYNQPGGERAMPVPHRNGQESYGHQGNGNRSHAQQRSDHEARTDNRRDASGSFIDQQLRTRVDTDIAAFLAAFDDALAQDTQDSRTALREATDRLLRAGARTRIELERLEARVPLTPREAARSDSAWRAR